jgi:predicted ester cyclase
VDRGHGQVAGKQDGPDGFAQFVKTVRVALPDIRATIQKMVAEGDYVAMWNTATATHRGELFGMSPSGKRIDMKDFHSFAFQGAKSSSTGTRWALHDPPAPAQGSVGETL